MSQSPKTGHPAAPIAASQTPQFEIRIGLSTVPIEIVREPPYTSDTANQDAVIRIAGIIHALSHAVDHQDGGRCQGDALEVTQLGFMALLVWSEEEAGSEFKGEAVPAGHEIVPMVPIPRELGNEADVVVIGWGIGYIRVLHRLSVDFHHDFIPEGGAIAVGATQFQLAPDSVARP
jgi:hypothetical protein